MTEFHRPAVEGAMSNAHTAEPALTAQGGILPVQAIRALIASGAITLAAPPLPNQLQPASLDLRLKDVAYRVRASFLPGPGSTIASKLDDKDITLHAFSLTPGAVLETGCVYIVPLQEQLALPEPISAACNPKSSTGRLDIFTRVIADGISSFDQIPAGYKGPLYAEICPQTFPVLVRPGSRLSQIRFRQGPVADSDAELRELQQRERLVSTDAADIAEGIALSVDLSGDANGLVGYRAKRHTGLIDVDVSGACAVADYWEPIYAGASRRLVLDPDQFYILASKEACTCRRRMRLRWCPSIHWLGSSACTMQASSIRALDMQPRVEAAPRPSWKCAATRCLSFWKTGRSWAV